MKTIKEWAEIKGHKIINQAVNLQELVLESDYNEIMPNICNKTQIDANLGQKPFKIQYWNLTKNLKKTDSKHPTHNLTAKTEDGGTIYIGEVWYSDTKGFGSIRWNNGVNVKINVQQNKIYPKREEETPVLVKIEK